MAARSRLTGRLRANDAPLVEGVQRYIKAGTEKWGALVRQSGLEGSH